MHQSSAGKYVSLLARNSVGNLRYPKMDWFALVEASNRVVCCFANVHNIFSRTLQWAVEFFISIYLFFGYFN